MMNFIPSQRPGESRELSSVDRDLERYLREEFGYSGTQLAYVLRDLKILLKREKLKTRELETAYQQMLRYAEDLRKSYLHERRQREQLIQSQRATAITLAKAIEKRDRYTGGHTDRVTEYAKLTAKQLEWPEERLAVLELAGHLHDVGKIGVPDAVLNKPGKLTVEEFEMMKAHPEIGEQIIRGIDFLEALVPYVLYHHERYDGKGYPKGLSGEAIPIEGRLLAVADTFDAMTSSRPYRKQLDPERAIEEIKRCSGTQFDPNIVVVFLEIWRAGLLDPILLGTSPLPPHPVS
ncbi:MAG: HD-GYP domain-containing protein [Candidatus Manganitrophus sp.]|nr:HD-GYP domain-containing protein [Candidatus Manganitrophus sp.]WDT69588.1 MAG: HD-GYP domain-containing protein [Candidatus Manganitrophus sp.]WDT74195.1 MAG: HD-GYP domain-containing protein [Candidatus Manganitrophus sp.]